MNSTVKLDEMTDLKSMDCMNVRSTGKTLRSSSRINTNVLIGLKELSMNRVIFIAESF
jgi:hypothetical protein